VRLGRVRGFTLASLVDSHDTELVLVAFNQVLHLAGGRVAFNFRALFPLRADKEVEGNK
jgi:hypothetical protein